MKLRKSLIKPVTRQKTVGQFSGLTDEEEIVEQFRQYFIEACSPLTDRGSVNLENRYDLKIPTYCGTPWSDAMLFDVALIDSVICNSSRGKAAGLDHLTAEHLQYSHPVLPLILTKLFNIMLRFGCVPDGFGLSYTAPLPKIVTLAPVYMLTIFAVYLSVQSSEIFLKKMHFESFCSLLSNP